MIRAARFRDKENYGQFSRYLVECNLTVNEVSTKRLKWIIQKKYHLRLLGVAMTTIQMLAFYLLFKTTSEPARLTMLIVAKRVNLKNQGFLGTCRALLETLQHPSCTSLP